MIYDEEEYKNYDNWEVRIGRSSEKFEQKEDALYYLIDEIDNMSGNKISKDASIIGYKDLDDVFYNLFEMGSIDFYNTLEDILKVLKIKHSIKLINLDDEEPEFGEL